MDNLLYNRTTYNYKGLHRPRPKISIISQKTRNISISASRLIHGALVFSCFITLASTFSSITAILVLDVQSFIFFLSFLAPKILIPLEQKHSSVSFLLILQSLSWVIQLPKYMFLHFCLPLTLFESFNVHFPQTIVNSYRSLVCH